MLVVRLRSISSRSTTVTEASDCSAVSAERVAVTVIGAIFSVASADGEMADSAAVALAIM